MSREAFTQQVQAIVFGDALFVTFDNAGHFFRSSGFSDFALNFSTLRSL